MHAIGRRFEPVHLHIAPVVVLLWGFFCSPSPAANPYPQTGPALDVYQQFVDHLSTRDFPALYPLLDEVCKSYLGSCLDMVGEIKANVEANPDLLKPEDTVTLRLMFRARDAQELFVVLMDKFFFQMTSEELAQLRCVEINPLTPTMFRLRSANGREFLLVNQNGEWKLDLSTRFLTFYEELCDTDVQIRTLLGSQ